MSALRKDSAPKTSGKRGAKRSVETAEKMQRAIELRKEKLTYAEIGTALKCSAVYAYRLVQQGIKEIPAQAVEELRAVENEAYNALTEAIFEPAIGGDLFAIDRVLKLSKSRRELNGLDAPAKAQIDVTDVDNVSEEQASEDFMKIMGRIANSLEKR